MIKAKYSFFYVFYWLWTVLPILFILCTNQVIKTTIQTIISNINKCLNQSWNILFIGLNITKA